MKKKVNKRLYSIPKPTKVGDYKVTDEDMNEVNKVKGEKTLQDKLKRRLKK